MATEIVDIQTGLGIVAKLAGKPIDIDSSLTATAGLVSDGANSISAAITASILDKVPDAIKNDPALAGVSTSILSVLGAVKKDDVQGLNDGFLLLSGSLTRGELSAAQYETAIGYLTGAFKGAAEAITEEANKLQAVIDALAGVNRDIARIDFTSFELALAEIQDRADEAATAFGSLAPEITALAEAERTLLNMRNERSAATTINSLQTEVDRLDLTQLQLQFLGVTDRATEYKNSLLDLGQATASNIAAIEAWATAQTNAIIQANAATAASTIGGLQKEIARINFTPLQKEIAGIDDQQIGYIAGLQAIGQATAGNIAVVNAWADAMRLAATNAAAGVADVLDFAGATDKAFAALERAVAAQRKTLETQLSAAQSLASEVGSIFDALKSSVADLYRSVDSTAQQSAAQARAFISSALSGALATGSLPESKALQAAISAATGGLENQIYASQFDAEHERLVLAGELSQLQEIAGDQLTEAERQIRVLENQLETLDKTLQTAREQIDVMRGVDISVISVAAAVDKLAVAMAAEKAGLAASATAAGTTDNAWARASPAQIGAGYSQMYAGVDLNTAKSDQAKVTDLFLNLSKPGFAESKGLPDDAYSTYHGLIFSDGADAARDYLGQLAGVGDDYLKYANSKWPAFAVGTDYVPRDMLAQIHEGEQIVPRAYNPHANGKSSESGNAQLMAELVAEVKKLRAEVAQGNNNTKQLADQFDSVSAGGNAVATEVMA